MRFKYPVTTTVSFLAESPNFYVAYTDKLLHSAVQEALSVVELLVGKPGITEELIKVLCRGNEKFVVQRKEK